MAWTSRDKYPCYGYPRRTLGCQDWCPDMRAAKEKNEARKAIERTMRTKDYIIKRKLMLWVHGIRVREVRA